MYGYFDLSEFSAEFDSVRIRIESDGFYRYIRESPDGKKEKIILTKDGRIIINPVEPVNLPKEITNFLLIRFKKPVFIEPKTSMEVNLTFPVEIGVFLAAKKRVDVIDIFSLQKPKYTLYGNPRMGIICRYWESDVYSDVPDVDGFREGVMRLRITNSSDEWIEVTNAVFDIFGMKIYYDTMVCSSASMNILSHKVAETFFLNQPLREGMKKALELYTSRKIPVMKKKFVMEWGI
ncbi:hypothetical protein Asulf_01036 [Archaeoglobus sulfaticallidus PM70-1]|uniref:DUF432 domain-containing protein n=1 Tax=Archaeoglobus sulfaticallidus PM70-1 TaxID=387631 RepID=N0BBR8_9EURY|nr:DUF432 domain-containing protein [Archaeoglobus sulfaticallidus]AGK61039.1 hypothetical protein Asulf_01036 [Archaeoglobus sulfaticallidus PM70-1]